MAISGCQDKKAILIDDILNTGKTFSEAAKSSNATKVLLKFMLYQAMVYL